MKIRCGLLVAVGFFLSALLVSAGDWPQWRGPNRDGKAVGFDTPKEWPKELTQKWKVTVGDGVATPALVGDKLYVFARQNGNEITRCLDAGTGKELWQDKYPAKGATGPAIGFAGPRSSPVVTDGKVVILGVQGTLSCLEAATGKMLWRKDEIRGVPKFCASSSPIVVDGLAIAQLGSESSGAIAAYDLASGEQKWKWSGDGTAYASPTLLTVGDTKAIVAETAKKIVAIGVADGKLLWETPFAVTGRGYNAASPMVEAQTILYAGSGRGTKAVKIEKTADGLSAKELWSNKENSVIYNTPVIKDGLIYAISDKDQLFCVNAETGKTAWNGASLRGRRGYGNIVDAGSVLLALPPSGQMIVFEPTDKEFKQVASYKVAEADAYAYPVLTGNRIFIKDKESVILWTLE